VCADATTIDNMLNASFDMVFLRHPCVFDGPEKWKKMIEKAYHITSDEGGFFATTYLPDECKKIKSYAEHAGYKVHYAGTNRLRSEQYGRYGFFKLHKKPDKTDDSVIVASKQK